AAGGPSHVDLSAHLPTPSAGPCVGARGPRVTAMQPPDMPRDRRTGNDHGHRSHHRLPDEPLVLPVVAADPQLLDSDLGGTLAEPQEKHLANCGWCRQRLALAAAHADLVDEEAFLAAARERIAAGAGRALETFTTLRPELHALTLEHDELDDVKIGQ